MNNYDEYTDKLASLVYKYASEKAIEKNDILKMSTTVLAKAGDLAIKNGNIALAQKFSQAVDLIDNNVSTRKTALIYENKAAKERAQQKTLDFIRTDSAKQREITGAPNIDIDYDEIRNREMFNRDSELNKMVEEKKDIPNDNNNLSV